MESRLKKELGQMEKQGIVDKPIGPTQWLNMLVIRKKSDARLHSCSGPKYLNKAIKQEHHPIPTKIMWLYSFFYLDAKQGYRNVKLDTASSFMTTFHTPFGR